MAVAGLQNVSAFGPFFGESTTRTSSVLRMWRELEGDHAVSSSSPSHRRLSQQRDSSNPECSNISEDANTTENHHDLASSEMENEDINSALSDSETEQACDGSMRHHEEDRVRRRPVRRLCGRQTLVDLLSRAQCERKVELQLLSEQKQVSEFSHRNRIQALLRGRFLRNEIIVTEKRPSSAAATELDFLRQRQSVSDLREEFLSKLDNSASTSSNNAEPDSSPSNENGMSGSGPVEETRDNPILGATQSADHGQELLSQSGDHHESGAQSHREIEPVAPFPNERIDQEVSMDIESIPSGEELMLENAVILLEAPIDTQHADSRNSEIEHQDASSHSDLLQDSEAEAQESSGFSTDDNRDEEGEDLPGNWLETFANQLFQEMPEATNAALDHETDRVQQEPQGVDWQGHDLQEAIDSWLLVPSSLDVGVSLSRFHHDHFPDDDETAQSTEIRQLSSRRRVSSLLRSSFRESLDQVLQSHVERQVHFSYEEEPSSSSSSHVLIGQEEENQYDPPPSTTDPNRLWDDVFNGGESFLHANTHRILGAVETINELRMDMAVLHQRMDHMQSLLEACIHMQIELQRCIRQEVSAALNRNKILLTRDIEAAKDKTGDKESQWEHVRRGICCLCKEKKINSLLYRCGHMCTCSECAVKLVRDSGNCPMCRAPIIEAVRAYFIQ